VGDTVIIQKAGDVIPDIVQVLKEMRTGKEKSFKWPTTLAACLPCGALAKEGNGPIERIPGQSAWRCVNKNSFAQQKRKFYHLTSKHAFDIENLGPKVIDQLMDSGLLSTYADIFRLQKGDLLALPRFAEKSADNLIKSIEARREVSLPRFLVGLSIPNVGEETAEDIAEYFGTLPKIQEAKLEELQAIEGVGGVVAQSIFDWFRDAENKETVSNLLSQVRPVGIETKFRLKEGERGKLKGRIFVLTGTLPTLSRDEAKALSKKNGGEVSSSVSSKTNFVLAGEEAGSKLDQAIKLGVEVINEEEFKSMLD
jgi:DNA ligase (NAD+)